MLEEGEQGKWEKFYNLLMAVTHENNGIGRPRVGKTFIE